jgi:hypothetical protein
VSYFPPSEIAQGGGGRLSAGNPSLAENIEGVGNRPSHSVPQNSFIGAPGGISGAPAAGAQNSVNRASSTSGAGSVTAPNASTEEVELSMKAFARELIGEVGGERASKANTQLTSLMSGTAADSATQKYLRKFVYALHLLNVPQMYSPSDAQHAAKRREVADALIGAIETASARHAAKPGNADEVFSAKMNLSSSTGKDSYKAMSTAWRALNDALASRGGGATEMEHMQAYYDLHVVPRTQLRAQFVYGETTANAETLLNSGSKQAVWDATRQLLCTQGANPEEKGMNLASASELLHQMPEFLRRPVNKPADTPEKNPERAATPAPSADRYARSDNGQPQGAMTSDTDAPADGMLLNGMKGAEHWNANINGDQIMMGPTININTGADTADTGVDPRSRRHGNASSPASDTASVDPHPTMTVDEAAVSENRIQRHTTPSGVADSPTVTGKGNTVGDDADLPEEELEQKRPPSTLSQHSVQTTDSELERHMPDRERPPGAQNNDNGSGRPGTFESQLRQTGAADSGTQGRRGSGSDFVTYDRSLLRTFSFSDVTRDAFGDGRKRTSRPSSMSGSDVGTAPGSRVGSALSGSISPSARTRHHNVTLPPPVIMTNGRGQQAPAETVKQWQADSAKISPTGE